MEAFSGKNALSAITRNAASLFSTVTRNVNVRPETEEEMDDPGVSGL